MTEPVDHKKAAQDAEWLAGSEANTAERNLARAYLALREQVATLTADRDAWEVACHNATIEKHEELATRPAPSVEVGKLCETIASKLTELRVPDDGGLSLELAEYNTAIDDAIAVVWDVRLADESPAALRTERPRE